jgi:AraC-like DNA-binding protein
VVREALEDLGLTVYDIELGKVTAGISEAVTDQTINDSLGKYGFELLHGKNQQLTERIKTLLIQYVQESEDAAEVPKISEYLSEHLNQNYSALSSLFSENEEITIEKYLISLKIERVKELLSYGELTLSEIAWKLNYSSVAHLSNQFKQVTGMSVTDYKKARDSFRLPLDGIEKQ